MNLQGMLTTDVIAMEIHATQKEEILKELVHFLWQAGKIPNEEEALAAVVAREKQMSTGIQEGVAIPHGKIKGIRRVVACIAVAKEGKAFDALDGKLSRIFVLTLSPIGKSGPHVRFLSEISRLLAQESIRNDILAAGTKEAVLAHFLQ